MLAGAVAATFLLASNSTFANAGPPEESSCRSMCLLWHGWAGAIANQLTNLP